MLKFSSKILQEILANCLNEAKVSCHVYKDEEISIFNNLFLVKNLESYKLSNVNPKMAKLIIELLEQRPCTILLAYGENL